MSETLRNRPAGCLVGNARFRWQGEWFLIDGKRQPSRNRNRVTRFEVCSGGLDDRFAVEAKQSMDRGEADRTPATEPHFRQSCRSPSVNGRCSTFANVVPIKC